MKRTRRRIAPNTFPSQSDPGQATPAKRLRPSDPDKNSPDETPQRLMTSPKATGHRPQASPKAIRAASLESSRSPDPPPVNNRPKNLSKSKIIQKIHKIVINQLGVINIITMYGTMQKQQVEHLKEQYLLSVKNIQK